MTAAAFHSGFAIAMYRIVTAFSSHSLQPLTSLQRNSSFDIHEATAGDVSLTRNSKQRGTLSYRSTQSQEHTILSRLNIPATAADVRARKLTRHILEILRQGKRKSSMRQTDMLPIGHWAGLK
ncbi:hypothetical protein DFH27DRAFT_636982 [Peziza echinospora]|nr:hypothetical protein DFH27DRAFT_636982 [Peziza echinospora]